MQITCGFARSAKFDVGPIGVRPIGAATGDPACSNSLGPIQYSISEVEYCINGVHCPILWHSRAA